MTHLTQYLAVSLLGALVGVVELVSRYRDDPVRAICRFPAFLYVAFNVIASILALYIIVQVRPEWLIEGGDLASVTPGKWIVIVLVAGTAALAFFRSSIFRAKIDDASVPIGPALILDTLLAAIDRAVDRGVATPRSVAIKRIMDEVDFDKAQDALPSYCLALMQNLSPEESQRLADRINQIKASTVPKDIKVLNFGLALPNTFGEDVLDKACGALKDQIQRAGALKDQPVGKLAELTAELDYRKASQNLPAYCLALAGASTEVQKQVLGDVATLDQSALAEKTKLMMLCLLLNKMLGMETLRLALDHLASEIRVAPPAPVVDLAVVRDGSTG